MTTGRNSEGAELLPCPFCGAQPHMETIRDYRSFSASEAQSAGMGVSAGGFTATSWAIECKCGTRIPGNNDDFMRARWNRRASPSAAEVQALVEELQTNGYGALNIERSAALHYAAQRLAKLIPRNLE